MSVASFRQWYDAGSTQTQQSSLAEDVFREAVDRFSKLSDDDRKISLVSGATSMNDIQKLVAAAIDDYKAKTKCPKARSHLQDVAATIKHYSNVLDMLSQHHPEYVALAWGAMKLLLTAFLNHEDTITTLAQALVNIARTLPRIEISTKLYPNSLMRDAVAELYAHLIRFFIRAHDWYKEGTFRRVIHSVTRPPELRYGDLLEKIRLCSQTVEQLSTSGGQAELRDVHTQVKSVASQADAIALRVQDIQDLIRSGVQNNLNVVGTKLSDLDRFMMDLDARLSAAQALYSSALLDTNNKLSDLQFGQILASIDAKTAGDQLETYLYYRSMRRRRATNPSHTATNFFWNSPRLKNWSQCSKSDLAIVRASFQSRFVVRDFAVDIVDQLRSSNVLVLWVLRRPPTLDSESRPMSTVELLRHLSLQALRQVQKVQTEKSMAINCAQASAACTEIEWYRILESVLSCIRRDIYLIIDMDAVDPGHKMDGSFNLCENFMSYFASRAARQLPGHVKTLLVGHTAHPCLGITGTDLIDRTIQARGERRGRKNALRRRRRLLLLD